MGTEDKKQLLMPIAVQWDGHVFIDERGKAGLPFALATCLSTVCNRLEVDPIRDSNIGLLEYWGAVGNTPSSTRRATRAPTRISRS